MSRTHLGGLAAAALVGTALASLPHAASAAAPTHGHDAQALAAQTARTLIASRAAALKISRHDGFRAEPVISSHGIQYVPYERTYKGLPVIGGDFVVVTDADGRVLSTSVAQTHRVSLRSVTPTRGPEHGRRHGPPPGAPRLAMPRRRSWWCGSTARRPASAGRPRSPATAARCPTSRTSSSTPATATSCRPASG